MKRAFVLLRAIPGRGACVSAAAVAFATAAGAAQAPVSPPAAGHGCGSSVWGPCIDSVSVSIANRYPWRGYLRGNASFAAAISTTIWGVKPKAGPSSVVLDVGWASALSQRATTRVGDQLDGSLQWRYATDTYGSYAWAAFTGYYYPHTDFVVGRWVNGSTEVGAGMVQRLPSAIPWPRERQPVVLAEVDRDLRRFDATYLAIGLRADYDVLPVKIMERTPALFLTVRSAWSGYPGVDGAPRGFAHDGWDAEARLTWDAPEWGIGALRVEVFAGEMWSHRSPDPNVFRGGLQLVLLPRM